MRFIIALIAVVCTTSCGSFKNSSNSKTGVVLSMSPIDVLITEIAISKLNTESKHDLITFNNTGNHYVIIYKVSDEIIAYPIIGRAWVGGPVCRIEIPERTFNYSQDLINTVIWHELGHCYRMEHEGTRDDIMYYAASPLSYYSQEAKERFFGRLYEATH